MYYLGLESRTRGENVYNDFEACLDDAAYIASRLSIPIRVFQMTPDKKSHLVEVVQPNSHKKPLLKRTFLDSESE